MPAIRDQVAVRLKDGLPCTELRLMLVGFGNGVRRRRVGLCGQDRFYGEKRRRTQACTSESTETNTAGSSEEIIHCLKPLDAHTISAINNPSDDPSHQNL
ncbi:hypothetical protein KR52_09350 [Synechococcus sp. KORDI-52]|nr:hypothetical protein KR52_09350 [Synechococcus sp. KORDI-52]